MPKEIELKLELDPDSALALLHSGILPDPSVVADQRAVYFDTRAQDLSKSGFSLRIREAGGIRIQTAKASGAAAAGLFVRPEWERQVETDVPLLDDTTPIRALLGEKADHVIAVFEALVERRGWTLVRGDSTIELVLDRGEIVAGDRRTPVCEIELELKHGSPAALFELARDLDAVAPLRLGVLSKAERGYRLLGRQARVVKQEPLILDSDSTAEGAFLQIAGACLRHFRLNEMLLGNRDGAVLHQARVALRRLRSAFFVNKAMLEGGDFQRLRDGLRGLASALGEARDLDVLLGRTHEPELRHQLERGRTLAYGQAEAALGLGRALLLDLSEWLAVGDWRSDPRRGELREQPAKEFASSALDRLRKKVAKGGRHLSLLDDAARHEVRKDAKKLRYACEFYASLFDDKRQKRRHLRFLEALEELQDALGALNDLATEADIRTRIGLDADAPSAPSRDRDKLIEAAVQAHDALVDAKRFWR